MRQHIITDASTGVTNIIPFTPEEEAAADVEEAASNAKAQSVQNARDELKKPMPATLPGLAARVAAIELLLGLNE